MENEFFEEDDVVDDGAEEALVKSIAAATSDQCKICELGPQVFK